MNRRAIGGIAPLALALFLVCGGAAPAQDPTIGVLLEGEIEHLMIDDPADYWSGGVIVVNGQVIVIPRNMVIELPANMLPLSQVFEQAPPSCLALGESGLARADGCRFGRNGGYASIMANRMGDGTVIAGSLFLSKGIETITGVVTYIDHSDGYIRLNGDPATPATTGTMVRINDPTSRHTIQQGLGCDGGPNCSPDPRYGLDSDNYTITFATGYPACLPSMVVAGNRTAGSDAAGLGDPFCPDYNRTSNVAVDSRRFAPIQLGDWIAAEGNQELINGVTFLSVHTLLVGQGMRTRDEPTQPDYMTFDESEWDVAGFQNERVRALFIGFTTLDNSEVSFFSLQKDPATGEDNEFPLGSTINNPLTVNQGIGLGAGRIFKVRFDVDFVLGAPVPPKLSPCLNLTNAGFLVCPNGGTMEEEFAILSPVTREIQGYTSHRFELLPGIQTLDIGGNEATHGQYLTPIGVGFPEMVEINLDAFQVPMIFAGIPWAMDRRLGPVGCQDIDADEVPDCESAVAAPLGTLRLDPFPFSGLDPRTQITSVAPGNIDRVLAHYPFGLTDILPWPPPTPGARPFEAAPPIPAPCAKLNAPPAAAADAATTTLGVAVAIVGSDLLLNDSDPDGDTIALAAVDSASAQGGTITDNLDGSFTYAPPAGFTGTDTFTYGIADGHGGLASGTVTVTVNP